MKRWMLWSPFSSPCSRRRGGTGRPSRSAASEPAAAGDTITFDQYRDFRIRDLQQRQARLARQLAAPDLRQARRRVLSGARRITTSRRRCPPRSATSSIASGSTRSTPITTARSTRRNAPPGAKSSGNIIGSNRPTAPAANAKHNLAVQEDEAVIPRRSERGSPRTDAHGPLSIVRHRRYRPHGMKQLAPAVPWAFSPRT